MWTFDLNTGDPLYIGMDITIASFDAISEVNMVRCNFFLSFPYWNITSYVVIISADKCSRFEWIGLQHPFQWHGSGLNLLRVATAVWTDSNHWRTETTNERGRIKSSTWHLSSDWVGIGIMSSYLSDATMKGIPNQIGPSDDSNSSCWNGTKRNRGKKKKVNWIMLQLSVSILMNILSGTESWIKLN